MTNDASKLIAPLKDARRLLFSVPLKPLQGDRFQPTGFPSLGAATYQTSDGLKLLVESAQSMANRMEKTCWDEARNKPVAALEGISHVTVLRGAKSEGKAKPAKSGGTRAFLTDTMLEAHRLNSPYLLENPDDNLVDAAADQKNFFQLLKAELGGLAEGPVNRAELARVLLKYDIGSLLHGVFLAKKELAGGRLRLARALSAFVEASGVRIAASGGVKNDHVNPSGVTKDGFGNVPFARDDFTAERIECHVNLDLAQLRGYGVGEQAETLLILLALHRVRRLLDGDLRFRTACDLTVASKTIEASNTGFVLPTLKELEDALPAAIDACRSSMVHQLVTFDLELKKGKDTEAAGDDQDDEDEEADEATKE